MTPAGLARTSSPGALAGHGGRRGPKREDPFGLLRAEAPADCEAAESRAALALFALPSLSSVARLARADRLRAGGAAPEAPGDPASQEGPRAPGEAGLRATDRELCPLCCGLMRREASNLGHVCEGCGFVAAGDTAEPEEDDAPRPATSTTRLRVVGRGSNQLQPDLYRSGCGTTAETQKKQTFEEYQAFRQQYIDAGGRGFPLDACLAAAEYYHDVQTHYVKRSQNKKAIMASCLRNACIERGFAPTKAEVAAFMQLACRGTARGDNFVRGLIADGKMSLEANPDPTPAEITTLFAALGYEDDCYGGLRAAVYEVVKTAVSNNIGTSSELRSKVAGATLAVLRRCQDRALVPEAPSVAEFCANRIRHNTLERVLQFLDDYHSFFEPVYRSAGLDERPPRQIGRR